MRIEASTARDATQADLNRLTVGAEVDGRLADTAIGVRPGPDVSVVDACVAAVALRAADTADVVEVVTTDPSDLARMVGSGVRIVRF
ncbi:hypothetical protein BH23ACT9_BH23ACT9_20970 [soil metagenome]